MPGTRRIFALGLALIIFSGNALASEILVAAASDLSFPMKEIISAFEKKTRHSVKLTLGSSGNFQAQIINGAPFDVYMSADTENVLGAEPLSNRYRETRDGVTTRPVRQKGCHCKSRTRSVWTRCSGRNGAFQSV